MFVIYSVVKCYIFLIIFFKVVIIMIGSSLCHLTFILAMGMRLLIGFFTVLLISLLVYQGLYPIQHMASTHTLKLLRNQGH